MPVRQHAKAPWADKFRQPSVQQLRASMNKDSAAIFDALRDRLSSVGELVETVAWQGVPWRWSIVYSAKLVGPARGGGAGAGARPWAYLIPDPDSLQLCVTLTADQIQAMDVRRLKKWVRDGIVFARAVGGSCWPTYAITAKAQAEDVFELIERKARVTLEPATAMSA